MTRKLLGSAVATVTLIAGPALVPAVHALGPLSQTDGEPADVAPMIFVHGGLGSGQQFEAAALRFASNGYPADHIDLFEHNSLEWPAADADEESDQAHRESVWSRLDGQIDDLLAATGADQVVLIGHSQGTGVSLGYLNSSPERAVRVARYINLDGSSGGTLPEGTEALAIWSERQPEGDLPGAENVHYIDHAHTEVVNSPEAFADMYRYITGEDPFTTGVVREPADDIAVGGRVQLFPQNVGADTATLSIFEIDGQTGRRLSDTPEATFDIDDSGDWGPFAANGDAFYEFALTRPDSDATHHVYPQPFVRSNPWMRVLTSEPGGLAEGFWETSDDHVNLVVMRNKEWWGDQGADSDVLEINGQEVTNEHLMPRDDSVIAIFVHDDGVDGQSDLTTPVMPSPIMFLAGANLHVPAADPPDGTVGVVVTPRRGDGVESVCVPNYASTDDRLSIALNSYHHMVHPDGSPAEGHANPECAPA